MAILDTFKKKESGDEKKSVKKTPAKKEAKSKDVKVNTKKMSAVSKATSLDYLNKDEILRRPYITEKAAILSEQNAYTFEISARANKIDVKRAMKALYDVNPISVKIINLPNKTVMRKGKKGVKSGVRKAIVFLAPTDKIEFVQYYENT